MIKNTIKLAGLAAALSVGSTLAFAEVKLNENFSVSGYLSGGYYSYDPSPGTAIDSFFGNKYGGAPIDTAQLLFTAAFKPVTGVASLYYAPNAPYETTLLDAYATYAPGGPVSVTAGKFLSYLGYESFFMANNPELSFANGDLLAPIPGYHSGVRLDISNPEFTAGVALLDSVYSPAYLKGDGEIKGNAGFEGYIAIKSIPNVTLWGGLAFDSEGNGLVDDILTWDIWAEWQATTKLKLAAEYANKDAGVAGDGYNWLVLANLAFTDKFSTAFRVSGEKVNGGGGEFTKWTIAPGVKLTEQLTLKAEVSGYDYDNYVVSTALGWGINANFKF